MDESFCSEAIVNNVDIHSCSILFRVNEVLIEMFFFWAVKQFLKWKLNICGS